MKTSHLLNHKTRLPSCKSNVSQTKKTMRNIAAKITLLSFFVIPSSLVVADNETTNKELLVVMNTADTLELSKQQIRHVFMGGRLSRKYTAINLPSGHPLRIKFNTKIIGLTESRIQSYWAQMKFTGRSEPPMEVDSTEEMLRRLIATEGGMAYFPAGFDLPEGLTIIYP